MSDPVEFEWSKAKHRARQAVRKIATENESMPIPEPIQARVVEILTERGFVKDGKIIRRPSLPK